MNDARGVTLIELVITIVIIGISLVAIVSVITPSLTKSADPLWQSKSVELMQAYLDEMLAMKFDATTPLGGGQIPGPCTVSSDGQTRSEFDDVDDYNGLDDQPPVLISGAVMSAYYAEYRVQVTVTCAGSEIGLPNNDYSKRLTITVTGPVQQPLILSAYKGNF